MPSSMCSLSCRLTSTLASYAVITSEISWLRHHCCRYAIAPSTNMEHYDRAGFSVIQSTFSLWFNQQFFSAAFMLFLTILYNNHICTKTLTLTFWNKTLRQFMCLVNALAPMIWQWDVKRGVLKYHTYRVWNSHPHSRMEYRCSPLHFITNSFSFVCPQIQSQRKRFFNFASGRKKPPICTGTETRPSTPQGHLANAGLLYTGQNSRVCAAITEQTQQAPARRLSGSYILYILSHLKGQGTHILCPFAVLQFIVQIV